MVNIVRERLLAQLPSGEEGIKYRMPAMTVRGKGVAAYDGCANHCSYLPMSGSLLDQVFGIPSWVVAAKGTLQFRIDRPLSAGLIRKLVKARLANIFDVQNGIRFDFLEEGAIKAGGRCARGNSTVRGAGIAATAA